MLKGLTMDDVRDTNTLKYYTAEASNGVRKDIQFSNKIMDNTSQSLFDYDIKRHDAAATSVMQDVKRNVRKTRVAIKDLINAKTTKTTSGKISKKTVTSKQKASTKITTVNGFSQKRKASDLPENSESNTSMSEMDNQLNKKPRINSETSDMLEVLNDFDKFSKRTGKQSINISLNTSRNAETRSIYRCLFCHIENMIDHKNKNSDFILTGDVLFETRIYNNERVVIGEYKSDQFNKHVRNTHQAKAGQIGKGKKYAYSKEVCEEVMQLSHKHDMKDAFNRLHACLMSEIDEDIRSGIENFESTLPTLFPNDMRCHLFPGLLVDNEMRTKTTYSSSIVPPTQTKNQRTKKSASMKNLINKPDAVFDPQHTLYQCATNLQHMSLADTNANSCSVVQTILADDILEINPELSFDVDPTDITVEICPSVSIAAALMTPNKQVSDTSEWDASARIVTSTPKTGDIDNALDISTSHSHSADTAVCNTSNITTVTQNEPASDIHESAKILTPNESAPDINESGDDNGEETDSDIEAGEAVLAEKTTRALETSAVYQESEITNDVQDDGYRAVRLIIKTSRDEGGDRYKTGNFSLNQMYRVMKEATKHAAQGTLRLDNNFATFEHKFLSHCANEKSKTNVVQRKKQYVTDSAKIWGEKTMYRFKEHALKCPLLESWAKRVIKQLTNRSNKGKCGDNRKKDKTITNKLGRVRNLSSGLFNCLVLYHNKTTTANNISIEDICDGSKSNGWVQMLMDYSTNVSDDILSYILLKINASSRTKYLKEFREMLEFILIDFENSIEKECLKNTADYSATMQHFRYKKDVLLREISNIQIENNKQASSHVALQHVSNKMQPGMQYNWRLLLDGLDVVLNGKPGIDGIQDIMDLYSEDDTCKVLLKHAKNIQDYCVLMMTYKYGKRAGWIQSITLIEFHQLRMQPDGSNIVGIINTDGKNYKSGIDPIILSESDFHILDFFVNRCRQIIVKHAKVGKGVVKTDTGCSECKTNVTLPIMSGTDVASADTDFRRLKIQKVTSNFIFINSTCTPINDAAQLIGQICQRYGIIYAPPTVARRAMESTASVCKLNNVIDKDEQEAFHDVLTHSTGVSDKYYSRIGATELISKDDAFQAVMRFARSDNRDDKGITVNDDNDEVEQDEISHKTTQRRGRNEPSIRQTRSKLAVKPNVESIAETSGENITTVNVEPQESKVSESESEFNDRVREANTSNRAYSDLSTLASDETAMDDTEKIMPGFAEASELIIDKHIDRYKTYTQSKQAIDHITRWTDYIIDFGMNNRFNILQKVPLMKDWYQTPEEIKNGVKLPTNLGRTFRGRLWKKLVEKLELKIQRMCCQLICKIIFSENPDVSMCESKVMMALKHYWTTAHGCNHNHKRKIESLFPVEANTYLRTETHMRPKRNVTTDDSWYDDVRDQIWPQTYVAETDAIASGGKKQYGLKAARTIEKGEKCCCYHGLFITDEQYEELVATGGNNQYVWRIADNNHLKNKRFRNIDANQQCHCHPQTTLLKGGLINSFYPDRSRLNLKAVHVRATDPRLQQFVELPGMVAEHPHRNVVTIIVFEATRRIEAHEELFIDYGPDYHKRLEESIQGGNNESEHHRRSINSLDSDLPIIINSNAPKGSPQKPKRGKKLVVLTQQIQLPIDDDDTSICVKPTARYNSEAKRYNKETEDEDE